MFIFASSSEVFNACVLSSPSWKLSMVAEGMSYCSSLFVSRVFLSSLESALDNIGANKMWLPILTLLSVSKTFGCFWIFDTQFGRLQSSHSQQRMRCSTEVS